MLRVLLVVAVSLLQVGCASVQGADGVTESRVLRLVQGGRLMDAAALQADPSKRLKEDPLALQLAELKRIAIATKASKAHLDKASNGLERARSLAARKSIAPWERASAWLVVRYELFLSDPEARPLEESDLTVLHAIASSEEEPASVRFDARKALYADSMNAGKLGLARSHLLKLISLADRLDWGINSQGAQALTLAAEFYTITGELHRAGEFPRQAFRIHSRYGAERNYFSLRAKVAAVEYLIALIWETRREESADTEVTNKLILLIKESLVDIDKHRVEVSPIHPDLDLRIRIVKSKLMLVPDVPWLSGVKYSVVDGPWHEEVKTAQRSLLELVTEARSAGIKRHEATAMRLLSFAYSAEGKRSDAAAAALSALTLARDTFQSQDFRVLDFLNAARFALLANQGTVNHAAEVRNLTLESVDLVDRTFSGLFPGSTFVEKVGFGTSAAIQFSTTLAVASGVLNETEEYEAVLTAKGRVHRALRREYRAFQKLPSHTMIKTEIVRLTSSVGSFVYQWDDGTLEEFETDRLMFPWSRLSRLASQWREVSNSAYAEPPPQVKVTAIQRGMAPDEVIVDFLRVDVPGAADQILAYVLGPTGKVTRHIFGDTEWVGPFANALRTSLEKADTESAKVEFDETSEYLWGRYFAPLESSIKKVNSHAKTIYIVPTRELSAAPFNALRRTYDGKYFGEIYNIALLFSAADLAEQWPPSPAMSNVLLIGDVDYGDAKKRTDWRRTPAHNDYAASLTVAPLGPEELSAISGLYADTNAAVPKMLLSKKAVQEAQFAQAARYSKLLHIHTHGFRRNMSPLRDYLRVDRNVLVNGTSPTANAEIPPLVGYALALTGTNDRNDGGMHEDDGILTGAEIALMDLSHVKLVVLSACDSAIGVSYSNEMMLGLATAFDYAGVHSVVGTVTPVNNAATRPLMAAFHAELLRGLLPADALRNASISVRQQNIGGFSLDMPRYWAPFVVFGVQRPN